MFNIDEIIKADIGMKIWKLKGTTAGILDFKIQNFTKELVLLKRNEKHNLSSFNT